MESHLDNEHCDKRYDVCRWETSPMGSLESLLRLRGAGIVRRAGIVDNAKGDLPMFGPQRCIKPYDPALVDVLSVLELSNYL